MYAILGDIQFENLNGYEGFTQKEEASYAEHSTVLNKPRLQKMGDKLDEIQLVMKFHNSFCDPATKLSQLSTYRKDGSILPFIYGTGEVVGDFVVVSIERDVKQTAPTGELVEVQCTVTLKEHYDPDKLASKETAAKAAAFAFKELKPLPVKFLPVDTNPVSLVMADINTAGASAQAVNRHVLDLNTGLSSIARAEAAIRKATQKVSQAAANAQGRISQAQAIEQAAENLPAALGALNDSALAMLDTLPITSLTDLSNANALMQSTSAEVNTAASPLAAIAALRTVI
jgi:phage protein U